MDNLVLKGKLRDLAAKKARKIRLEGNLVGVVYGADKDNLHIEVDKSEFIRLYRQAGGNTIVRLEIDGNGEENVLVHEIDYNPITDEINNIDFLRVKMDEKITAKIPVEFVGQSKAVKDDGGVLITDFDELEVTCLPADLPKVIEVDISTLNTFDDAIYIKDLKISDKVEIEHELDQVIATVVPPRSEEELKALDEEVTEDVGSVEVSEEKAKEEEEKSEEAEKKTGESKEK